MFRALEAIGFVRVAGSLSGTKMMFRAHTKPDAVIGAAILIVDAPPAIRPALAQSLADAELTWVDDAASGTADAIRPYDLCIIANAKLADAAVEQLMVLHAGWAEVEVRLPIIAVCETEEDARRWLEAGADDLLFSPLHEPEIRGRAVAMLRSGRATAELTIDRRHRAEQTQTLLALLELSTSNAIGDASPESFQQILTAAGQLSHSQRAALLLRGDSPNALSVVEAIGAGADEARGRTLPRQSGIAADAIETGRLVRVRSLGGRSAEAFGLPWSAPGEYVAMPLHGEQAAAGAEFVGAIIVGTPTGGAGYSAGQEQALELIMHFASTTISRMFAQFWREEARDALVLALVELTERRDNDTARHLDRVSTFSMILAEELRGHPRFAEVDELFLSELRRAVPLHDIGKVAIPDSILLKPGRLTDAEMQVMRTHATIGGDAIASVRRRLPNSAFARIAEDIARHHHERFDGKGYPGGLAGTQIPLAARIVAVADVYDALTTKRVYKPALTHEAACDILRDGQGSQFDPLIIEAFERRAAEIQKCAEALSDERAEIDANTPGAIPVHWFLGGGSTHARFLNSPAESRA